MDEMRPLQSGREGGTRRWLRAYPWEDVVRTLAMFWHLPPEQIEAGDPARIRARWQCATDRELTLGDALSICRECQMARPFGKYDCESFVIIARDIVKPFLGQMNATFSAAITTIVGDYVRGSGDELEMRQTLNLLLDKFSESVHGYHAASPGGL